MSALDPSTLYRYPSATPVEKGNLGPSRKGEIFMTLLWVVAAILASGVAAGLITGWNWNDIRHSSRFWLPSVLILLGLVQYWRAPDLERVLTRGRDGRLYQLHSAADIHSAADRASANIFFLFCMVALISFSGSRGNGYSIPAGWIGLAWVLAGTVFAWLSKRQIMKVKPDGEGEPGASNRELLNICRISFALVVVGSLNCILWHSSLDYVWALSSFLLLCIWLLERGRKPKPGQEVETEEADSK